AHGGEVQVTSVLGKGTKFTMSFPLKQVTLPTSDEARGEAVGRFDDSYLSKRRDVIYNVSTLREGERATP
ncbi:MAG: hypothetical protein HY740_03000, partial [Chloroflexi bacterium]|nr:hypothetical protein [Chloroflexota bacterium]